MHWWRVIALILFISLRRFLLAHRHTFYTSQLSHLQFVIHLFNKLIVILIVAVSTAFLTITHFVFRNIAIDNVFIELRLVTVLLVLILVSIVQWYFILVCS